MNRLLIFGLVLLSILAVGCATQESPYIPPPAQQQEAVQVQQQTYNPQLSPSQFSTSITNKYFTLTPGDRFEYRGESEDGVSTIITDVLDETKTIQGIETRVVRDREYLNGELIEDTYDWYAQDSEGNVWYLGEDSKEMLDGKVTSTSGSWEHGVDGAIAGIVMKANPRVGDEYWQEYYVGEAEDKGTVLAVGESHVVAGKIYNDCVRIKDWTPLDLTVDEEKIFCAESGFLTFELDLEDDERVELQTAGQASATEQEEATEESAEETFATPLTEEEAEAIALAEVPGKVTNIGIERKYGKPVFVVEVRPTSGPETDVIINIETGEILGIED